MCDAGFFPFLCFFVDKNPGFYWVLFMICFFFSGLSLFLHFFLRIPFFSVAIACPFCCLQLLARALCVCFYFQLIFICNAISLSKLNIISKIKDVFCCFFFLFWFLFHRQGNQCIVFARKHIKTRKRDEEIHFECAMKMKLRFFLHIV